ncbi:hypothetical protein CTEN210_01396 [Chaetoceros tenuissimus]|uniref:Calmodulin n=1 Tax=Chaetoceros tenuissimus TaxID=426638 RepID=A0AAD3CF22_9STRA|nr:hypothetical protein CTEN210_01396 [Chaetoceros tenuissimus]
MFLSSYGHGFLASITNCNSKNKGSQQTSLRLADDSIEGQKGSRNEARSEDTDDISNLGTSNPSDKPKSRLALLAEDWLEEEEDELSSYWERFDENKNGNVSADSKSLSFASSDSLPNIVDDSSSETLTTEERLERYYDSRGINKKKEEQFKSNIEYAIDAARKAATAEIAIAELEKVQPYLQVNSKLGGSALYELAIALWQRDGRFDEELIEKLMGNVHIKRELQQLMKREKPPSRQNQNSMWQDIFNPNSWWN